MSAVKFFGGPSAAAATVADPGPWGEGPGLRPMLGDAVSAARAAPWRVAPLGGGIFAACEPTNPVSLLWGTGDNGRDWTPETSWDARSVGGGDSFGAPERVQI